MAAQSAIVESHVRERPYPGIYRLGIKEKFSIVRARCPWRILIAKQCGDVMKSKQLEAPSVIAVGAAQAGLPLRADWARREIYCLVVEQNEREGYVPRAKTTHTRTRELSRRSGIAEKLAKASPFGIGYPSNIVFVTRLAGQEIARIEDAMFCAPQKDERYSEHAQCMPQYRLEAVLASNS